jgi:hypothetical protein
MPILRNSVENKKENSPLNWDYSLFAFIFLTIYHFVAELV